MPPSLLPRAVAAAGRAVLSLRYRVDLSGADEAASRGTTGILFLPNHPALVDPLLVVSFLYPRFRPRPLADRDQLLGPLGRAAVRLFRVVVLPDPALHGRACLDEVRVALAACAGALRSGENVVLWPAGRIARGPREHLGANSAVETLLAAAPGARVVLVRSRGLWGSSFSRAAGTRPDFGAAARGGIVRVLAHLLLFTPRRPVSIELSEPRDLPRQGGRAALNRYLEEFYNREGQPLPPPLLGTRGGIP